MVVSNICFGGVLVCFQGSCTQEEASTRYSIGWYMTGRILLPEDTTESTWVPVLTRSPSTSTGFGPRTTCISHLTIHSFRLKLLE